MISRIRHLFYLRHSANDRYREDRFCERYDAWKSCCYDGGNFERKLIPRIEPAGVCVELGAGTGFLTRLLAGYCSKVYAYDRSPAMIDYATNRFRDEGISNVVFGVADHLSVVPPERADIVVAGWTLLSTVTGNWEADWEAALDEVLVHVRDDIARSDGRFIVIETGNMFGELPPGEVYHPKRKAMFSFLETRYGFKPTWIETRWTFDSIRHKKRMLRFWGGRKLARQAVGSSGGAFVEECVGLFAKRYSNDGS